MLQKGIKYNGATICRLVQIKQHCKSSADKQGTTKWYNTCMFHSIRVLGSAALALCHVAMGVAEAYHIDGLQCWDVAAGALIVTEAGGTVMDSTGIFSRGLTSFYKWSYNLIYVGSVINIHD